MISSPRSGPLRAIDVASADFASVGSPIDAMYENTLDVLIVRGALPATPLASLAESFDRGERDPGWARPNAQVASDDIQVLGTAATPTYSTPRGPTLDAYLASARSLERAVLFDGDFDAVAAITGALERISGRPVELLQAMNGESFAPYTVRRLTDGKGIGLHHDLHTSLPMFKDIAPQLDTSLLISYFVTLQGSDAGGELYLYNVAPDTPDPPKLPNGFSWDLTGVESRFSSLRIATRAGDLLVFASARCLHRVAPVSGARARVTMGGFLTRDKSRGRILYWS